MGLQLSMSFENGIYLETAYLVISNIQLLYKDVSEAVITLSVYKDKSSYDAGKPEIINIKHVCSGSQFESYFSIPSLSLEGKNPIDNAYEWLLLQEAYFEAEEV
jgi:hypothetical protein